jgi:hypothetical protein
MNTNINTEHRVVQDRTRANLQPGTDAEISNVMLTFTWQNQEAEGNSTEPLA